MAYNTVMKDPCAYYHFERINECFTRKGSDAMIALKLLFIVKFVVYLTRKVFSCIALYNFTKYYTYTSRPWINTDGASSVLVKENNLPVLKKL